MPTGHENEGSIGVRVNRVEFVGPAPGRTARPIVTALTSELLSRFARSDRFAPASGSLREGLEVTVQIRDVELESGGRRPYAACKLTAEGVKISGGKVAEMAEKIKFDLDKDRDQERQFQDNLGDHAAPFFVKFVKECDKRY